MGNGSPRLLRHLLVRASACVAAMLWFAPPASADAGLVTAAGAAVPDPGNQSVGVSPLSAVHAVAAIPTPVTTAPPAPVKAAGASATPVTTPRIPVEKAVPTALATTVAKAASVDRPPAAGLPTPQQRQPARAADRRPAASSSAHPATTPQSAAGGVAAAARVATVLEPNVRSIHLTHPAQPGARPVGAGREPLPQPPAPLPLTGGAGGAASTGGIALLLFALAAEGAILAVPGFRRRIAGLFAVPRPYPYLLRLERPD
jgi:membrane-associated protease RseP (regulator of RpoE activity)